jgi:4'-phosphopantetheinyl transferase
MEIYIASTNVLKVTEIYEEKIERLSSYRQDKIERLSSLSDKVLSLGAGLLLHEGLKQYGIDEKEVDYVLNSHGMPSLKDHPEMHFNLSHSGTLATVIVDNTSPVGIDVERIRDYPEKVAKRFFSSSEQEMLEELKKESQKKANEYFFRCWTRRESYGKLQGTGLDFTDDNLDILMDEKQTRKNKIYFWEYIAEFSTEARYIISACSNDRAIKKSERILFNLAHI